MHGVSALCFERTNDQLLSQIIQLVTNPHKKHWLQQAETEALSRETCDRNSKHQDQVSNHHFKSSILVLQRTSQSKPTTALHTMLISMTQDCGTFQLGGIYIHLLVLQQFWNNLQMTIRDERCRQSWGLQISASGVIPSICPSSRTLQWSELPLSCSFHEILLIFRQQSGTNICDCLISTNSDWKSTTWIQRPHGADQ